MWNKNDRMVFKSHVEKMINMACSATDTFGNSYLLADSYFFSDPALTAIRTHNITNPDKTIVLISKAKKNCTAWTPPDERKEGKRGRPNIREKKVHLRDYFNDPDAFTEVKMNLYGKEETVKYMEVILLWGKNYTPVKFVLTISSRGMAIFVCTDTNISAVKIITYYSKRWSIMPMSGLPSKSINMKSLLSTGH